MICELRTGQDRTGQDKVSAYLYQKKNKIKNKLWKRNRIFQKVIEEINYKTLDSKE